MDKQRLLSLAALLASFFAFIVIGLGAFTRLMDAGLGCPDWPGCYGHIIVPSDISASIVYKAWAEMIHRYAVGGLSIFILVIVTMIFSIKALRKRTNIILASALILLLVYQILLGQWTVTLKLLPFIVTQHLLGGFLILSTLWLVFLSSRGTIVMPAKDCRVGKGSFLAVPSEGLNRTLITGSLFGLILLFLQIFLGAWTSTNYASLSCPDFPFCVKENPFAALHLQAAFNLFSPTGINYEGGVLPETVRQTIQMIHRLGALILTIYAISFFSYASLKLRSYKALTSIIYVIFVLLFMQICIGIINIIFKLPLITAMSHNLIAVLLLLSLITFTYQLISQRIYA